MSYCLLVTAMELALSLEKLTNEKLLNLHRVRQDCFIYLIYIGPAIVAMELQFCSSKSDVLTAFHTFASQVASKSNDVQLADFVETEFLGEQVNIKFQIAVSQLFFLWVKDTLKKTIDCA